MPHIVLLEEWKAMITQLCSYVHTIQHGIDEGEYKNEQLAQAQQIITDVTAMIAAIDAAYRTALDNQIGACEAFLGV